MERVVVLEIRDLGGHCRERHRLEKFPVEVGRAYSNEIILDDAEVCPQHLRIERTEAGEFLVKDLGSLNGTIDVKSRHKISEIALQAELSVQLGETILRLVDSRTPVSPTVPTRVRHRGRSSALVIGSVAFLLNLGLDYLSAVYFGDRWRRNGGSGQYLLMQLIIDLAAAFAWICFWGVISKISGRRARLANHLCIYSIALLAWGAWSAVRSALVFSMSNDHYSAIPATGVVFLLLTWMIKEHLRYGTQIQKRRRLGVAVCAAAPIAALCGALLYFSNTQFSPTLSESLEILPPPVPHTAGVSAEVAAHKLVELDGFLAELVEAKPPKAGKAEEKAASQAADAK